MFGILALQFVFMLLVIRVESIFTHSSTLISIWKRFTSFDTWKSLFSRVEIYEVVDFMLVVSFWGRKCHVSCASSQGRTGVRIFRYFGYSFWIYDMLQPPWTTLIKGMWKKYIFNACTCYIFLWLIICLVKSCSRYFATIFCFVHDMT